MDTETEAQQPDKANILQKTSHRLQRTKAYRRMERSYAWKLAKNLLVPDFFTRMGGVSNGLVLLTEGIGGALSLSLPLLLTPLGGLACCALAGAGLYGITYGLRGLWNSAENALDKTFHSFNPLKKIRLRTRGMVQAFSQKPFMQKLRASRKRLAEKIAQNPRFIKMARKPLAQKFLNSRLANCRRGLTPAQRDVFLAGIAIQGSLATLAFCGFVFAHVAAAPITVGTLLSGTMLFASYQAITSPFGIYCYAKTLKRIARNRKTAKKGKPAAETTISVPPSQETKTPPVLANSSPAFNREAGIGAPGRTRTDTSLRTQDFESSASTNSTTGASGLQTG